MQQQPRQKAVCPVCGPAEDQPHAQRIELCRSAPMQGGKEHRLPQNGHIPAQRTQAAERRPAKDHLFHDREHQTAAQDPGSSRRGFCRFREEKMTHDGQRRPQQRRRTQRSAERRLFLFFLHAQPSRRRTLYHIRHFFRKQPGRFTKMRRNFVQTIDFSHGHLV